MQMVMVAIGKYLGMGGNPTGRTFLSSKKGVDLDRAVTTTATSQYSGMEPIGFFKDNRTGFKCKMISEREIHCDLTVMQ